MTEAPRLRHASRLMSLAGLALLAACASATPPPGSFSFAVLGDTPYNEAEEREFVAMMARIDREPVAFVVHVGDFKGGGECSDALYERRRAQFDASAHPFAFTPGDNEWTDCRQASRGGADPLERLARLRQVFFATPRTLGRVRLDQDVQDQCLAPAVPGCGCAAHPENRAWSRAGVRFVTLNIPGSHNNVGFDRASDEEARCRNEANRRWLERAADAAAAPGMRALVAIIQANPWDSSRPVYRGFLSQLETAARRLARPVLLVHGDTHAYRVDQPLPQVTRLETYGSPFVGWVKVNVDFSKPEPFSFEPHLQRFVLPR